jgi:hypothetical protein
MEVNWILSFVYISCLHTVTNETPFLCIETKFVDWNDVGITGGTS